MHRKNKKWEEIKHRQAAEVAHLTMMKDAGQQDVSRSHYHTAQAKIKDVPQHERPPSHAGIMAAPWGTQLGYFQSDRNAQEALKKTEGIG